MASNFKKQPRDLITAQHLSAHKAPPGHFILLDLCRSVQAGNGKREYILFLLFVITPRAGKRL